MPGSNVCSAELIEQGGELTARIREFRESDLSRVEDIAAAAWVPVFDSFRELVGDTIFDLAFPEWEAEQRRLVGEACHGDNSLPAWVALDGGEIAGFITAELSREGGIGEISFNAVHPDFQNRGIGTQMYTFVLDWLKGQGMKVIFVSTGGDPSHAPARRAYEKAGFTRAIPSVRYYLET